MGKQRHVTIALAGSGESSLENTTALLNDFLGFGPEDKEGFPEVPEDLDVRVILPLSDTHTTKSVMGVFDWTEYADLPYELVADESAERKGKDAKALLKYAEVCVEAANVNAKIIDLLKEAEGEKYLFLFWGEEGDENAEVLLDLASAADIPAKDLTAGLDDLSFDDPEEATEPEPEPEPEPEERPRRGRRRQQEAESKPLEDKNEEPDPEPEEKPRRRGRARQAEEPAPEPSDNDVDLQREVNQRHAEAKQENSLPDGTMTGEGLDTPENGDDLFVKALAIKHEAKRLTIKPEVSERFVGYPSTPEIEATKEALRRVAIEFAHYIHELVPAGREQSLALTKAEEAYLWAREAIDRKAYLESPQEDVQETQEQASRGRGRPRKDGQPTRTRTAAEKAVVEIWDEDEEKWVRKGRGRVPKGARTRLVDPKTGDVVDD